jgi:hypothetical protein
LHYSHDNSITAQAAEIVKLGAGEKSFTTNSTKRTKSSYTNNSNKEERINIRAVRFIRVRTEGTFRGRISSLGHGGPAAVTAPMEAILNLLAFSYKDI